MDEFSLFHIDSLIKIISIPISAICVFNSFANVYHFVNQ